MLSCLLLCSFRSVPTVPHISYCICVFVLFIFLLLRLFIFFSFYFFYWLSHSISSVCPALTIFNFFSSFCLFWLFYSLGLFCSFLSLSVSVQHINYIAYFPWHHLFLTFLLMFLFVLLNLCPLVSPPLYLCFFCVLCFFLFVCFF